MNYEKAYKEALGRAKAKIETYNHLGNTSAVKSICEIFSELKESEDELKWLTEFIREEAYYLSMDIRDNEDRIKLKNLQRSLAWLEKQSDSYTKKDVDNAYLEGMAFAKDELEKQGEQKPTWSEEDEIGFDDAMWAIEQAKGIAKDENDMGNLWYAERFLESIKERMKGE